VAFGSKVEDTIREVLKREVAFFVVGYPAHVAAKYNKMTILHEQTNGFAVRTEISEQFYTHSFDRDPSSTDRQCDDCEEL
jgi:hypothetical protein